MYWEYIQGDSKVLDTTNRMLFKGIIIKKIKLMFGMEYLDNVIMIPISYLEELTVG